MENTGGREGEGMPDRCGGRRGPWAQVGATGLGHRLLSLSLLVCAGSHTDTHGNLHKPVCSKSTEAEVIHSHAKLLASTCVGKRSPSLNTSTQTCGQPPKKSCMALLSPHTEPHPSGLGLGCLAAGGDLGSEA